MFSFKRKVRLPTTHAEFDALADELCRRYKLHDTHHAAALLSIAIRHIPNEEFYTTYDYLGDYIRKNIANSVAWHKGETLKHEGQVRALESLLSTDPGNCQAMDELKKAANEGSEYAAAALKRLIPDSSSEMIEGLKGLYGSGPGSGALSGVSGGSEIPMRAELEADAQDEADQEAYD